MKSNYTWKYKVVKENGYSIHRVHYKGNKAIAMSEEPPIPYGDTAFELMLDLEGMLSAASNSIYYNDFFVPPKKWK